LIRHFGFPPDVIFRTGYGLLSPRTAAEHDDLMYETGILPIRKIADKTG